MKLKSGITKSGESVIPLKLQGIHEELASNLIQKKSEVRESEIRCKEKINNYLSFLHNKDEQKRIFSLIKKLPQLMIDRETGNIFRGDEAKDKERNRTLDEHELQKVYAYLTKEMEDKIDIIKNNKQIKGYKPTITFDDMKENITNAIRAHAYFCKDISASIDKGQTYPGSFEQGKKK